jgi:hypothetical protein
MNLWDFERKRKEPEQFVTFADNEMSLRDTLLRETDCVIIQKSFHIQVLRTRKGGENTVDSRHLRLFKQSPDICDFEADSYFSPNISLTLASLIFTTGRLSFTFLGFAFTASSIALMNLRADSESFGDISLKILLVAMALTSFRDTS